MPATELINFIRIIVVFLVSIQIYKRIVHNLAVVQITAKGLKTKLQETLPWYWFSFQLIYKRDTVVTRL